MPTTHIHRTHGIGVGEYDVTERKKAELDAKALEVLNAQMEVDQFQVIVAALTQKLNTLQGFLATADSNRKKAYDNKTLVDQLIQSSKDLLANSSMAFNEMVIANVTTQKLAVKIKDLMDKLIYSVEMINKLSVLVVRKKALNPLISDELITMIGKAGGDANNAVALTLIALQSAFAAQAANIESEAAATLEYTQSRSLYQTMTYTDEEGNLLKRKTEKEGKKKDKDNKKAGGEWSDSLQALIFRAYIDSKSLFDQRQIACDLVTSQLNIAKIKLNKAQVKLKSLQSGLSALKVAALVS